MTQESKFNEIFQQFFEELSNFCHNRCRYHEPGLDCRKAPSPGCVFYPLRRMITSKQLRDEILKKLTEKWAKP